MRNRTRGMVAGAVGAAVAATVAGGAVAAVTDSDGRDQDQPSTNAAERAETTQGDLDGDGDGDGHADLGVGAPEGTVSGEAKAGYVGVTYGAKGGVDTERRSTLTQASKGVPGTPEATGEAE